MPRDEEVFHYRNMGQEPDRKRRGWRGMRAERRVHGDGLHGAQRFLVAQAIEAGGIIG